MENKPNIILITIDALRADHLGFMGYQGRKDISPNIDSLARESAIFTRAFSVGPNSPHSFPSILTSTYPLDYQGLLKIERPRILLSEVLKEQGYITAGFHSTPYLSDFFGYNQGWDFFEYVRPSFGKGLIPNESNLVRLKLRLKDSFKRLFKKFAVSFYPKILFKKMYSGYLDRFSANREIHIQASYLNKIIKDFISSKRESREEKPFFLWAHYMDVHSPYFPIKNRKDKKLPLSFAEFVSAWLPGYLEYSGKRAFKNFIKSYFETMVDFYDQGIEYLDGELADLLNFLKEKDIYQDTVICITSDHGEEFLEHGDGFHNSKLYNELLFVPLLIKIPGKNGQRIERKVSLIDLAPTLCELAGIKSPSSFKGENIFTGIRDMIFHQSGIGAKGKLNAWVEIENLKECKFACQSAVWKYILDYPGGNKEELYNISDDPQEQSNLAKSEPKVLSQMRDEIVRFKKENPPLSLL